MRLTLRLGSTDARHWRTTSHMSASREQVWSDSLRDVPACGPARRQTRSQSAWVIS